MAKPIGEDSISESVASRSSSCSQWSQWQLLDSILPTGGFAHSFGLEAAVQTRSSAFFIMNGHDPPSHAFIKTLSYTSRGSPGVPGRPRNYPHFIGEMVVTFLTIAFFRFRNATVLIDMESLSLSFTFSAFTFIRCEHNDVVDALAKAALLACSSILYLY
ncbi:hypothetical protein F2Q68_00035414 [Brassica cretica]|uniref:Urease accessory protein UreF n=1 Tax=Brassica cretica TaxID=69181 RepID=A0A8S9H4S5_BRACR|nr:hypothetical protein F2Q68_00035414 [Brassica cretica]